MRAGARGSQGEMFTRPCPTLALPSSPSPSSKPYHPSAVEAVGQPNIAHQIALPPAYRSSRRNFVAWHSPTAVRNSTAGASGSEKHELDARARQIIDSPTLTRCASEGN